MQKFEKLTGLVVPLGRSNVDTDAIIPKQFLKSIHRTGFGPNLFDAWRYLDHGELGVDNSKRPLNPDFVLNDERYRGAQILIARANFGCGSSREHAVWALQDYGIRAVVAPSFADIFYNNCFKNGMLPVVLEENAMDQLFKETDARPGYSLDIDLSAQTVTRPDGDVFKFDVDGFRKRCLLDGLDDIGLTLQHRQDIEAYEQRRRSEAPWLSPNQ
jgi:3-isopropylmalate/(R)-2-methylmalate dehydratase small subunit